MYQLVGMGNKTINQKIKYLIYLIDVIQVLLGKICVGTF